MVCVELSVLGASYSRCCASVVSCGACPAHALAEACRLFTHSTLPPLTYSPSTRPPHPPGVYSVYDAANSGYDCTGTQALGVNGSFIRGCPSMGRLSRWAIRSNGSAGREEVLLDGTSTFCTQFDKLGVDNVEVDADGFVVVSVGVGANENSATGEDHGQFGTTTPGRDACTNSSGGWGGAFRAQLDSTMDGKVLRVDPNTTDVTVLAKGLHNAW